MAKKTKLGSASRFGARYSTPLKEFVRDIEKVQKKAQNCPECGRKSLKRKSYSIWECGKCGARIAGGAYEPRTALGEISELIVRKGESYEKLSEKIEKETGSEKQPEEEKKEPREEKKEKKKKEKKEAEEEEKEESEEEEKEEEEEEKEEYEEQEGY